MPDQTLFPNNATQNPIGEDMTAMQSGGQTQEISQNITGAGVGDGSQNTEMYQKVIDALMTKLKSKAGQLNSMRFAGDNQNSAQRNDILKSVFDAMRKAGINPSDPQSINTFMGMLAQQSPDLYQLFVTAMNRLLGPEGDQTANTMDMGPTTSPEVVPQDQSSTPPESTPGITPPSQYPNLAAMTQ